LSVTYSFRHYLTVCAVWTSQTSSFHLVSDIVFDTTWLFAQYGRPRRPVLLGVRLHFRDHLTVCAVGRPGRPVFARCHIAFRVHLAGWAVRRPGGPGLLSVR